MILDAIAFALGLFVGASWQTHRIRKAQRDHESFLRNLRQATTHRGEWEQ